MPIRQSILERFMKFVSPEPNSGCWLWMGSNSGKDDGQRYGRFYVDGVMIGAHRVSYELFRGQIPKGLELDHLCRMDCCVNPDHLEPVTHIVNVRRGAAGKILTARTHCKNGHEFDEKNTYWQRRPNGGLHRDCRQCNAINMKHTRAAKRASSSR